MVAWKGQKPATPEEIAHMAAVKLLPCCMCRDGEQKSPTEVHHIVRDNKRLGNFFVLPLCRDRHHKYIRQAKMLEQTFWEMLNEQMSIEREWPETKIVKRKYV